LAPPRGVASSLASSFHMGMPCGIAMSYVGMVRYWSGWPLDYLNRVAHLSSPEPWESNPTPGTLRPRVCRVKLVGSLLAAGIRVRAIPVTFRVRVQSKVATHRLDSERSVKWC